MKTMTVKVSNGVGGYLLRSIEEIEAPPSSLILNNPSLFYAKEKDTCHNCVFQAYKTDIGILLKDGGTWFKLNVN